MSGVLWALARNAGMEKNKKVQKSSKIKSPGSDRHTLDQGAPTSLGKERKEQALVLAKLFMILLAATKTEGETVAMGRTY